MVPARDLARDFNMAPIRLKEVIVFSSQDPVHRADNLLKLDSQWKRWLCAPEDRSGSVQAEFQLEKAAKIGYVDIGNYGSAFVEILARKSSWSSSSYRTLVPATMLMSPMESKTGQNKCAVKMFTKAALSEDVLQGEWDQIKVKCSQPYKKDSQFGLAFIRLRSLEEPKEQSQSVSPGPTMSKLLSKSDPTLTASKPRGHTVLSPSWKTNSSFQRQITAHNPQNKYSDAELKSRLLKMAATTEAGSNKSESLSRSAKMVLASSNGKHPATPKHQLDGQRGKVQSSPSCRNPGFVGPNNQGKVPSVRQEQHNSDVENCQMISTPVRTNYSNSYLANTSSTPQKPPEPNHQTYGQKISLAVGSSQRKTVHETVVLRQPTKRPSNTNFETSPSKMKNSISLRSFKDSVNVFLVSLGPRLLDSKLSDIRPSFEKEMSRKLNKEERKTLKELAVERVDVLIKNGSFPTHDTAERPNRQTKCKQTASTRGSVSAPVSVPSSSADVVMDFRNCPKCYLKFTARQITGHVLSCQGIKSARGVGMATTFSPGKDSQSPPAPGSRRGNSVKSGRGRGNGKRGSREAAPLPGSPNIATYSTSPHVRAAQMPSYQHKGQTTASSTNLPTSIPKPDPPHKGTLTTRRCSNPSTSNTPKLAKNYSQQDQDVVQCAPCPICFDRFPMDVLEMHADLCLERNLILQEISNRPTACC